MLPLRRILCPIDFSNASRRALDRAIALARTYRSSITVVHISTPTPALEVAPYIGPAALQPFTLVEVDRAALLAAVRQFVVDEAAPASVTIESGVADGVDISREILAQAHRVSADLIVMGTHSRSGLDRLFLGSVTEKVLRAATCPVMTVPPASVDAAAIRGRFARMLCAVDFSRASEAALHSAVELANDANANLIVVHAVELLPDLTEPPLALHVNVDEIVDRCRTHVARMIPETIRRRGAVVEEVVVGKAHREILRIAEERAADLIVMGAHGRGALDRLLFGSTTHRVVREATCPVLTVRAEVGTANADARARVNGVVS